MAHALSYKEFIEEYDQNHIRRFRIPSKFLSQYRFTTQLTYNEWITLLSMWIPGEVPDDSDFELRIKDVSISY